MSNATIFQINATDKIGLLEVVLSSTVSTLPCCVFLFINGAMLFSLRSKSVFRETSRYIFLFNLLFADTLVMVFSQLMYMMAARNARLTYPVCGVLMIFNTLSTMISPLTLVVMSLERYVAVCYPLRHATIVTIRNTEVAVIVIWAFSSLNVLTRGLLLLNFPFENLESLQMEDRCSSKNMLLVPVSVVYDKVYTYFVFASAVMAVFSSYVGVVLAARSASTDKTSARKARNTLLLHLVQLGLSLSSTIFNPMLRAAARVLNRVLLLRLQTGLYVCVVIFPRCLSALIYGIRDQTIRPVFISHLCCQLKLSVIRAQAKVSL